MDLTEQIMNAVGGGGEIRPVAVSPRRATVVAPLEIERPLDHEDIAAAAGFACCTDDPAWQKSCSIDLNEWETFGPDGDGDPEDRGSYPRPISTFSEGGAYRENETDIEWSRVVAYLQGLDG